MATIRKRNGKFQVQVRRTGYSLKTKTFALRKDAEVWAREIERALDRDEFVAPTKSAGSTLGTLLKRYQCEVTPTKRSARTESPRINLICRHPIARKKLAELTPMDVAIFRDERLKTRASETVRQDLILLRQVLETARREWGIHLLRNPVDDVRKPESAQPRSRRLMQGDAAAFKAACNTKAQNALLELIGFARSTGMRRGEILRIEWADINWTDCTLFIPTTKTDQARHIPLTDEAIAILNHIKATQADEPNKAPLSQTILREGPFVMTPNAVRLAWRRLVKRAGIDNLRFHDLRHEAISTFFELGLSTPEVQLISGHRDVRQLMRYTHMQAADVGKKLRKNILQK